MPVVRSVIREDSYRDSIFLMTLSAQAAREGGAEAVSAMMATDRNKDLFAASGLLTPEIAAAKPNDLAIAIRGDADSADRAAAAVLRLLDAAPAKKAACGGGAAPHDLRGAVRNEPGLNLALISVAGDYARYEAALALDAGMDVMLYSDNVSIADELALKRLAARKGLLVMGPDCGTAIVNGTPLAFANRVARGPIGLVAASGTGLQEVCCLLDRLGVGVSQAYGTGGRDLKDDIGGVTAFAALDRLAGDARTEALVILGKPPGGETRKRLLERCKTLGRPVFVHYIGASDYAPEAAAGLHPARDLTELSVLAARHFKPGAVLDGEVDPPVPAEMARPGFVCGIFGGGTLCQEAAEICGPLLAGPKASNLKVEGFAKIAGGDSFAGHTFWDFGEDEFTVGRPHPMMAPDLKMERLASALRDPKVSLVLMDMVIGYGSHPRQAELAAETLAGEAGRGGAGKIVAASVCGVEGDNPSRSSQADILRRAGVTVLASNAQAARWAAKAVLKGERDGK